MCLAGGVLCDSWCTPQQHKLDIIATAHPNPTQWPREEVTPAVPATEDCQVQATVDPAASASGPAAATAAVPQAAACAAPQPTPAPAAAAAAGPLTDGVLEVCGCGGGRGGGGGCTIC